MEPSAETGFLVLADVSGYSSYLAEAELEHAEGILADVLETVVDHLTPMLALRKLEGDAVFVSGDLSRGEALLDVIESTYVAFRDRRDTMRRTTTCSCRACASIGGLDLKFVAHHGTFVVRDVAGSAELVGSDVNLVHRLLKNGLPDPAYVLMTRACVEKLAEDVAGLRAHTERYEHFGDVALRVLDLHERHDVIVSARRVVIEPSDAHVVLEQNFAAPPPVVFEWLTDPVKRTRWASGTSWSAGARPGGRTGPGAVNHCAHGDKSRLTETIMDWRPPDYVTTENRGGRLVTTLTTHLDPLPDGGTRMRALFRVTPSLPRWLCRLLLVRFSRFDRAFANAARVLGEEVRIP